MAWRLGGREHMEMLIGFALVVIAAIEIVGMVRVVSSNLKIGG